MKKNKPIISIEFGINVKGLFVSSNSFASGIVFVTKHIFAKSLNDQLNSGELLPLPETDWYIYND